tara:strand:- start:217 stop:360 length:144 start_codon:yes stop_codon:yes gene_type:complete
MITKILIIYENESGERSAEDFKGDELTSPIHDAIAFLQQELEKEMEF